MQALFQSAQHLYEKREGSGAGSIPMTNSDPGGPKTWILNAVKTIFLTSAFPDPPFLNPNKHFRLQVIQPFLGPNRKGTDMGRINIVLFLTYCLI